MQKKKGSSSVIEQLYVGDRLGGQTTLLGDESKLSPCLFRFVCLCASSTAMVQLGDLVLLFLLGGAQLFGGD